VRQGLEMRIQMMLSREMGMGEERGLVLVVI
jgi:hypothetical protein